MKTLEAFKARANATWDAAIEKIGRNEEMSPQAILLLGDDESFVEFRLPNRPDGAFPAMGPVIVGALKVRPSDSFILTATAWLVATRDLAVVKAAMARKLHQHPARREVLMQYDIRRGYGLMRVAPISRIGGKGAVGEVKHIGGVDYVLFGDVPQAVNFLIPSDVDGS